MGLWFNIRNKIVSNKHLRILRNNYIDYINIIKYKISLWKNKQDNVFGENRSKPLLSRENFREYPFKIAFAVTESGSNPSSGDYFTAAELGDSLKKFGWEITFLPKEGPGNWYYIGADVDVVISMLETYDPHKIRCNNKSLIKMAWARNWFERWIYQPNLSSYDLIFASSQTACDYIQTKTGLNTFLLPIATNPDRFNDNILESEEFICDYCFTGSYWDDPRDIIEMLDPEDIPYTFKLYGKNWENFSKFRKYYQGFLNYSDLPRVYASTKLVIDDVNRGSKNFGSVNSRVYDALSSGTLVITNGVIGAGETFHDKLPVWRSKEELNDLIRFYLDKEDDRREKIKELQDFVLENHVYENRARTLKDALFSYLLKE